MATMKTVTADFDVAIAGAGPGGLLAALRLAEAGFTVGLFDASSQRGLGRSLVLETERTVYRTVGLPEPSGEMVPYEIERMRFLSSRDREVFSFDASETDLPIAVNLDVLCAGILRDVKKAGVRFFSEVRAVSPVTSGKRVTGMLCRKKNGADLCVNASITIDATGFNAALVRVLPDRFGFDFPDSSRHVVSAANCLHELIPANADRAIAAGLFAPDEIVARMGVHGAYSTVYSFLSKRARTAYLLVGLMGDRENVVGAREVVDDFLRRSGCFGRRIRASAGNIRVRHSLDRMVADGFMAVGEAACTVFPMHGSGVASALITGMIAARTAAGALRAKDVSAGALWPYAAAYQRDRGARLAAYDATRLTLDAFSEADVAALLEGGVMQAEDTLNGLQINRPRVSPQSIPARLRGFAAHPRTVPAIVRMGITVQRIMAHYRRYPASCDEASFAAWRRKKKRIFGTLLSDA